MQEQYKKFYDDKLNEAMKDAWDRLHECLSRMSEKLSDASTPRVGRDGEVNTTQIFRDSLVTNAVELCSLLTKLNVTNDPKLERMRKKLESAVAHVSADELRKERDMRMDTKQKIDEILSLF